MSDAQLDPNESDPSLLWAEIIRLRAAVAGPDGYESWQDAATAERVRRVRAEAALAAPAPQPELGRAQHMRDAGYTRRPTLREMSSDVDPAPQPTHAGLVQELIQGLYDESKAAQAPQPTQAQIDALINRSREADEGPSDLVRRVLRELGPAPAPQPTAPEHECRYPSCQFVGCPAGGCYDPAPQPEPIAVIGPAWQLLWASGEPLTETLARNPGLRIGSKLYAETPAPSVLGGNRDD